MSNENNAEMISFYLSSDFKFKIGKTQKEVIVPRMEFATGGRVISKIATIQGKDVQSAINLLVGVKNGEGDISKSIETVVTSLIKEKSYDLILEVLALVSEGKINKDVVEKEKCQYDEVLKLLAHLVNENFASLKNLSASLKAIIS